jgi:hypothetical protein
MCSGNRQFSEEDGINMKKNDNVVYVKTNKEAARLHSEQKKQTEKKKQLAAIIVILLVICVCAGTALYRHRCFTEYKVIESTETNYENTASYVQYATNLLKYTPDGVSYINANGDTVWSAGINMNMPIAATCGDYAIVADLNGNTVCVFDTDGQVSNVTMPYTICDIDIAKQGVFAVVLESDKTNYVNLYTKDGDIINEMQTTIDKSGYPIDIAISDNGEKMLTSYLNVNGTTVTNSLAAYNFGDVGQNTNADRMVGGYTFEDELFPKVEFIDNNTVVAFGTNTIYIYSMKEKPSESAKIYVNGEVQSVFYNADYIGVVYKGGDSENPQYILTVYEKNGKKKFSESIDFDYDKIYAADEEIIITGGTNCKILRKNGSVKFEGDLGKKIVSMVPDGKDLEYVVVYANSTDVIKLKSESVSLKTTESTDAEISTSTTNLDKETATNTDAD